MRNRARADARELVVGWPDHEPSPGTHFWADQVVAGLRANGVTVEPREIPQLADTFVVLTEVSDGHSVHTVVFDPEDGPELVSGLSDEVLVYFKLQYQDPGYGDPRVVPGGYLLANNIAYRYLPLVRALRNRRRFRYDVYGRFGLRYGGVEVRKRAVEILSARSDFRFEGNLFKYPGGPEKVPYRQYLFEIARAKVCVDMPGAGALCTRLIDYLAVGACVVGPRPAARLPVPLVDGTHVVHCADDLSDLGDICAELVNDGAERERIARNGREYFDRHLNRRQLGSYYLTQMRSALHAMSSADSSLASGG